jgi:predicted RNA-binding protein with PIN domain
MMNKFLIDGNNLIWKIPELKNLQKDESTRTSAREKLIFKLQRLSAEKRIKITLFFDGAPHAKLGGNVQVEYSYERKADELIREAIDKLKTKRTTTVVSSDRWITDYAKVNGCKVLTSDEFFASLVKKKEEKELDKEVLARDLLDEDWEDIFGENS